MGPRPPPRCNGRMTHTPGRYGPPGFGPAPAPWQAAPLPRPARWYATPTPPPSPLAHPDRDPRAYVAPLIATVTAGPVLALGAMAAMFSPMATDSCAADGCHALYRALALAPCLLTAGYAALGAAWALPWRRRLRVLRTAFAVVAPLFAVAAVLVYLHLPAPD